MFNGLYVENEPEGGVATLEVLGDNRAAMPFVPLRRVEISGEVTGPVAGMQVVHLFGYTKQQCSKVIEALYRFPLPGDAAVTGVSVRFGDVEIQAVLEPRAQAERDYEQAKKDRKQAALVTQEAGDVFTLRVAGIQPDQDVRVETAFVQLARAEGAGWSLRIPLTVVQRYTRQDEDPRAAQAAPLAQATDPGYRASLDLTVFDAAGVASPTHALAVTQDGSELHAHFQEGDVLPDCDTVITWQPASDTVHTTLSGFAAREKDRTSFLALVTPPSGEQRLVARELTVLVDHSGSMEGPKWDAADWAVTRLIGLLTEQDRFRIGVFHSTVAWWSETPRAMDSAARADAVRFLESHKDSGGTELGVALEQALRAPRPAGEFSRQVLIVTDAQVSDAGRLVRLVEEEFKRSDRRRVSILVIDSAPNEALASQLAEAGGGYDRYVTSNPEGEDITTALDAIVDAWARPIAIGLRLEVEAGAVYVGTRRTVAGAGPGWTALDVGDLPSGRPLWVSGEVSVGDKPLSLRLVGGDGTVVATWTQQENTPGHAGVAVLAGARRLQQLEALRGSQLDATELRKRLEELGPLPPVEGGSVATIYPENQNMEDMLSQVICRESLRTGLLSSETAFVAIRSVAGKSVERTVVVANATPEGWEEAQPMQMMGKMVSDVAVQDAVLCAPTSRGGPDLMMAMQSPMAVKAPEFLQHTASTTVLFDGVPAAGAGRVVLAEYTVGAKGTGALQASRLVSLEAKGDPGTFPAGAQLLLFVGSMARARATVLVADLLTGTVRPLNITCSDGQVVRLVLVLPGTAPQALGHLAVTVGVA